ncbi:hypothetical protein FB45DRAFT_1117393 [Roridomyces roridus]|uniref:Uncharacterized protein n=1 Tax=Roridomyces roridus TaxID=1738132 RepID=A0AAD7B820_9AGAR|nr:hypothetical protein FB45DRAFT_1117393 [Roridomyces roridus]
MENVYNAPGALSSSSAPTMENNTSPPYFAKGADGQYHPVWNFPVHDSQPAAPALPAADDGANSGSDTNFDSDSDSDTHSDTNTDTNPNSDTHSDFKPAPIPHKNNGTSGRPAENGKRALNRAQRALCRVLVQKHKISHTAVELLLQQSESLVRKAVANGYTPPDNLQKDPDSGHIPRGFPIRNTIY